MAEISVGHSAVRWGPQKIAGAIAAVLLLGVGAGGVLVGTFYLALHIFGS